MWSREKKNFFFSLSWCGLTLLVLWQMSRHCNMNKCSMVVIELAEYWHKAFLKSSSFVQAWKWHARLCRAPLPCHSQGRATCQQTHPLPRLFFSNDVPFLNFPVSQAWRSGLVTGRAPTAFQSEAFSQTPLCFIKKKKLFLKFMHTAIAGSLLLKYLGLWDAPSSFFLLVPHAAFWLWGAHCARAVSVIDR